MSLLQSRQTQTEATTTKRAATTKKPVQAWRWLILIFATFLVAFGAILMYSGFLFLAFSAILVLAIFSAVIIALAWAYQNDK